MMEVKLLHNEDDMVRLESCGNVSRDDWGNRRSPLEELCGEGIYARKVLLNISKCQYMDSTGVEWLLSCHKRFCDEGGLLVVHSPSPVLLQILKMMKMNLVLNLADNETAARALACGGTNGR